MLARLASLLDRPELYRLWQAPFAERKFAPVLARGDLIGVHRVLDVACGPGTNAHHFASASYVGMDLNRRYVLEAGPHKERRVGGAGAPRPAALLLPPARAKRGSSFLLAGAGARFAQPLAGAVSLQGGLRYEGRYQTNGFDRRFDQEALGGYGGRTARHARYLAERLASASHAPHELIVTLANDEIQIADPILRRSGILKDADLVEIVRHRTQEHRVAIATREQLSPDVTQALLDSGDTDAIEALINNHDVEITRRAMDYLVGESQRVDSFQQPLLRRPDLPPQLAHRMFWWASAALREYILTNFRIDEVTLDSILHETTEKVVRQAEGERSTYADAEFVVAEIANRGQLNERFLLQCLRRGRLAAFTAAIAKMAGINIELARWIIFDPGG